MIVVHGFAPMPPLPSPSPFCIKLETWLRMASFAYEARADYNPLRAPRGQAPYVTLEDGSVVADTHQIIKVLSSRPAVTLDRWIGGKERATTVLVQRTVENHLYSAILYTRWHDEAGFGVLKQTYFGGSYAPVRWTLPHIARRKVLGRLHAEGTSREPAAEILAGAEEDLDALQFTLGDRPFFCGEKASTADAVVYGGIAGIHLGPFPGPLQDAVRARPKLVKFVERMRERYWP